MAGRPKMLFAFNTPMTSAASDTSRMKGNMICVSCAVRAALSGANPGASSATSGCANKMPSRHSAPSTSTVKVATLSAKRHAARSPSRAMVFEKVVTNAVDSAPSANRSRSRFGMRKATVKASIAAPPNNAAQISSRASPSTRLLMIASPITPAALVFSRSVRASGAMTSSATSAGSGCLGGRDLELMKNRRPEKRDSLALPEAVARPARAVAVVPREHSRRTTGQFAALDCRHRATAHKHRAWAAR